MGPSFFAELGIITRVAPKSGANEQKQSEINSVAYRRFGSKRRCTETQEGDDDYKEVGTSGSGGSGGSVRHHET